MRLPGSFQRRSIAVLALPISLIAHAAFAQLPFFSGAEGYGGSFSGTAPAGGWFSNATVYHVTNLSDSGTGSLRGAFVENSSNKIIVFDVAGTIQLTSGTLDIKNLANYYIAGQTAPGPVTIYGDMAQLTHSSGKENRNVVLRYLTFRKGTGNNEDSITFAGGGLGTNLILDHVSASWSEDEVLSVANNNTNVTVQYSMINDALVSNHAYGSLIRPRINSAVSFHHNLYANNASRQARFGTYDALRLTADFRNNVVYNWRDRASYAGGSSEAEQEYVDVNYVGNYLIAGPATAANTSTAFIVDKNVDVRAYQSGNFIDSDKTLNPGGEPNGADTGWGMFAFNTPITDQTLTQMTSPLPFPAESPPKPPVQTVNPPVTTESAIDAYWNVVEHVGNFWWLRDDPTDVEYEPQAGHDTIDQRVILNVLNNTSPPGGIAASAPYSTELSGVTGAPLVTRPAGWDTDNDGMPDAWELQYGLNLSSSADWKLDFDNDGYINLVEYLNEAGEFPAPAPIVFDLPAGGAYELITNWKTNDGNVTAGTNWQPSKYDEAQINSGTVVSSKVGQHAGLLKIAANSGNNATLNVTGGWLNVADEIIIGATGATAALNLSGGVLTTDKLSRGTGGTFNFTGGTLHSNTVSFTLTNNGGTLAPGQSIGQTHVEGNLLISSGTLQIELSSAALSDTLIVDDTATLGGSLSIVPLAGFTPTNGNNWQIITSGAAVSNQFSSITPGYNVLKLGNNLLLFFGVPGDFNGDHFVNAADYVGWRKNGGTQLQYETWRANFGAPAGGSGSTNLATVPEPRSQWIFMVAVGLALVGSLRSLRVYGRCLQK